MLNGIAVIISAALLAFGLWAGIKEASLFFDSGATNAARFDRLEQNAPSSGLSSHSSKIALADCNRSLASFHGRIQPPERRNVVFDNCRQYAGNVLSRNPSDGLAWYVAAEANAGMENYARFNEALYMSHAVTEHEAWIADVRVRLSLKHLEHLSPAVKENLFGDIATLTLSENGALRLSKIYTSGEKQKNFIIDVVEKLEPEQQRRFVRNLRKLRSSQAS